VGLYGLVGVGGRCWDPLSFCAPGSNRSLLRRFMIGRSVRLLGELKAFDSAEFVNAVSLDDDERSPIERKAQDSPRQVAGSIQSMLSRGKTRGKR
jgi:hypothetical protein